jgi:hypothetical protein
MGTGPITTKAIFARVDETLGFAKLGARDVRGKEVARRLPGLMNVAVFGRSVTIMLQGLRSTEGGFDAWYAPKVKEMEADPLLEFFKDLRTDGLKKTKTVPISQRSYLKQFDGNMARFGPPPPGAIAYFIGDRFGGTGWRVRLPDGSEESYYVDIPEEIGGAEMIIVDAPKSHLGKSISDNSASNLCDLYVRYLGSLVDEARRQFPS